MPSSGRMRLIRSATSVAAALLLLHGCAQEPSEPITSAARERYQLTIESGSSSASGSVTSNRGGISCSIVGATGGADASGACSRDFAAGAIVTVTANAASGAVLKLDAEWGATCTPNVEDPRYCKVTMDRDRTVAPTFVPAPTSFTLTVAGGAAGNGSVYSMPAGISCTIANGEAVRELQCGVPPGRQGQAHRHGIRTAAAQGVGRRGVRDIGRWYREGLRVVPHYDGTQRRRRRQLRGRDRRSRGRCLGALGSAVQLARGRDQCGGVAERSGSHLWPPRSRASAVESGEVRPASSICRCRRTSSAAALRC